MSTAKPEHNPAHTTLTKSEWYGLCEACQPLNGLILDEETWTTRRCSCLAEIGRRRAVKRAITEEEDLLRMAGSLDTPPVTNLKPSLGTLIQRFGRNIDTCVAEGRGLWFEGGTGNGKTTAAVAIAKAAHHRGHRVGRWIVPELLGRLRRTYDENDSETCEALIRKLVELDVLVLDDLGTERHNQWVVEKLYLIINGRCERVERYNAGGALIVATNLAIAALEEQIGDYGERIISRLHRLCDQPLHFEGLDHRRERARDLEKLVATSLQEPTPPEENQGPGG